MKTLWNAADADEIRSRLEKLSAQALPQWGSQSLNGMLLHCADPIRTALGEMEVQPKSGPFRLPPIKLSIIYWMPWPKNAPTAPEYVHKEAGDWQSARESLRRALDRFAAQGQEGPWKPHPAFGDLTGKQWGRLTYRHLDHHLRQFGV